MRNAIVVLITVIVMALLAIVAKADDDGVASWYGAELHGQRTASGERFDMNQLTAAHRSLPFGTLVKVTNVRNGQSTTVRINDRGPFAKGRVIDLSQHAASQIGMVGAGTAPVTLELVQD